jgi:aspartyl-tRNA(Asn)/glutamyl-tRNA(Gln) amidotransferase subunit A
VAMGSDTGGSVRLPAAYCGIIGLKPTYGRLSRFGLVAYASSMDCPGIIGKDVKTVKEVLELCEGYDPKDSTSLKSLEFEECRGRRIVVGIPQEFNVDGISEQVRDAWIQAALKLREHQVDIVQVSIPSVKHALAVYYIIAAAEAASNLSRYTGLFFGNSCSEPDDVLDLQQLIARNRTEFFGEEVKRRILAGTFVLSNRAYQTYFGKAQKIRKMISDDFQEVFKHCDYLLTPTAPTAAVPVETLEHAQTPIEAYAQDVMTVPANLVGLPAVSIPIRSDRYELPVGVQLMGKHLSDHELLKLASILEQI